MRQISNPQSRFDELYREWEVEPPPATLEVFEDHSRSILSHNDSPDVPFSWSLNPYRGCTHACAYCYARPDHEYIGFGAGTDFDSKIVIKPDAASLLRAELSRPRWRGELICMSGDTDCYQPLEARYRLTRACLEVMRDAGNPVSIITKSFLITRDVDLLKELAADGLVTVVCSIAFADDDMSRRLEPGAPRPSKRFEAMRILSDAGVPTELLVGPVIPGLNDEQPPRLLELAAENGARAAGLIMLRLPGVVQEVFLTRLREEFPLRADRVEARLREARGGDLNDPRFGHRMRGGGTYWRMIEDSFRLHRQRLGLADDRRQPPLERQPTRRLGQLSLFPE